MPTASSDARRARFDALFEATQRQVLAYCLRRVREPADGEDAAADTYAVAWRRIEDLPAGAELPWLYGIARRVLANQRRSTDRRRSLVDRLLHREPPLTSPVPEADTNPALDALATLRPDDRDLLRLVAWEGLDHAEIATVLGISVNAVAIRLHRARKRFADAYLKEPDASRTSTPSKGGVGRRPGQEGT